MPIILLRYILLTEVLLTLFSGIVPKNISARDNSKISVVVIDPGHGGQDWGASIGSAKEKHIVLDIALMLGQLIENNHPEIEVIYTRKTDVFIPLHKRAEIANKSEADVFISIHVNSVAANSVQGTESYVLGLHRNQDNLEVAKKENSVILLEDDYTNTYEGFDPNSPESYIMFETMQAEYQEQSILLASNIQKEFSLHSNRINRSVKMAGFLVLRRTSMPSVLIEAGFLSHAAERKYLLSKSGQESLARSIYNAFNSYKKEIEQHSSFSLMANDLAPKALPYKKNNSIELAESHPSKTDASPDRDSVVTCTTKQNKTVKTVAEPRLYYSIQIMALKQEIETSPQNFKGETKVFSVKGNLFTRYFIGRHARAEAAEADLERIKTKYPNAFMVAFKNNELISVKKAKDN